MGNSSSTETPSSSTTTTNNNNNENSCPVKQQQQQVQQSSISECPVRRKHDDKYVNPNQYNVYSQKIDPKNNMPVKANQDMAPDQREPLDTTRVKSNIPKGGTEDDTWSYPSPQM